MEIEITCPNCLSVGETSGLPKLGKCFQNLEKGVWHCFHCGAKGKSQMDVNSHPSAATIAPTSFHFSKELLENYQAELEKSPEAKAYLKRRFGGLEVHAAFQLGYDSGRRMIVIPNYEKGEIVAVKYRAIDEGADPKYLGEPGSKAGVFRIVNSNSPELLICEGEFDSMAAVVMDFQGTVIAVQTNRISEGAKARIQGIAQGMRKIYIVPDSDKAGEALIKAVEALEIDHSKVAVVSLKEHGFKDLSELLEARGFKEACSLFNRSLGLAKTKWEESTFSVFERLPDTLTYLLDKKNHTGVSTGFRALDRRLGGGLMPYTLTALSAPGKTGKTTVLIALIHNVLQTNAKVGFISLEMSPTTHIIPSLLSIASGQNVRLLEDQISPVVTELQRTHPYLNNLVFFDRYGTTAAEEIEGWIRDQHLNHGVNLFFLDHVGYSLKDIKDPSEHSKLSKMLRGLTRFFPIHIFAIVQPKNLPYGQKQITKHDLYGSVTWQQDISQLLTLERSGDNQVSLRLTDAHNPLARPSEEPVLLFYDPETCSISE